MISDHRTADFFHAYKWIWIIAISCLGQSSTSSEKPTCANISYFSHPMSLLVRNVKACCQKKNQSTSLSMPKQVSRDAVAGVATDYDMDQTRGEGLLTVIIKILNPSSPTKRTAIFHWIKIRFLDHWLEVKFLTFFFRTMDQHRSVGERGHHRCSHYLTVRYKSTSNY